MNAENVVKDFSQPHIGGGKKRLKNDIEAILGYSRVFGTQS